MGSRPLVASTHTYYYNSGASAVPSTSHHAQVQQAPMPWKSTARSSHANVMRLALEPRPFDVLEFERKILQNALNRIDERARDLVKELAAAGETTQAAGGRKRREATSQHVKLKNQIADTVEEEKATWLHLAELHIEIQSRERWCAVWQEHERTDTWAAESQRIGEMQAGQQDEAAGTEDDQSPQHCSPSPPLSKEAGQDAGVGQARISNPFATDHVHRDSENLNSTATRVHKRNSLPSLQYVWSGTSDEAGHICSGYGVEN